MKNTIINSLKIIIYRKNMKYMCISLLCISAIHAMETENSKQLAEKALSYQNKLVAYDKEQREQFSEKTKVYRGALYSRLCKALDERKEEAKELKKNIEPLQYAVFKAYYRSCPNRAACYPECPGQKTEYCSTCSFIFKESNYPTQTDINQKKLILNAQWNLHVMYNDKIKNLADYYFNVDEPQKDLINLQFCAHDLKEYEKHKLDQKKAKILTIK